MDNEARKAEIRTGINRMRYPRRGGAKFTDANDHNPIVLKDCPGCRGSGKVGEGWVEDGLRVEADFVCPVCDGSGTNGEVERFFTNDSAEIQVVPDPEGWLTCPNCRWRFTIRDRNAWTGRRHFRCGQKLRIASAK